jgi:DNA topoisomerase-3
VDKGATVKLKGFNASDGKVDGQIVFGADQQLVLKRADGSPAKAAPSKSSSSEMPACPKCKKGTLIKGKTAYGCSLWKTGCDFKYSFAAIKEKAAGQELTKALVLKIIGS